jgi:type IV pilus assembly protein PilM
VLGLDWGGGPSLKYVLLRRTTVGLKLQIETFGRIAVPADFPEAIYDISQSLHELFLRERLLKKSKIIIGLGSEKAVLKKESFPNLTPKELRQTIVFGILKDLGKESGDEIICDFLPLGPDPSVEGNNEYLCFGSDTQSVSEKAGIIASEGVVPVKIVPNVLALTNLLDQLPDKKSQETVCFLDIGANRSVLVFFKNRRVDFFREIVIGGEDFTKAITGTIFHEGRAIQFTTKEAHEFKYKHGYPLGFSEGMTFRGAPLSEVGAMMRPVVERLTGEIHRSVGFYREKSGGGSVDALYLIGGGAQLKHLSQVLTERLNIQTTLLPQPQNIRVSGGSKQDQLFRSKYLEYGAALALALETSAKGNLLPAHFLKLHRMALIQRCLNWAAVIVLTAAVVFSAFDWMNLKKLKSQTTIEEKTAEFVSKKVFRYEKSLKAKNEIGNLILQFDDKIKQNPNCLNVLRFVSNVVPKSLSLTSISIGEVSDENAKKGAESKAAGEGDKKKAKTIIIKGDSKLSVPDVKISVAQFMLSLSKSGYITDVKLQDEKMIETSDEYNFTIEGILNF